ncbi:MAG: tetratricopeptide repeat protein [Planctomycetota bacterium]|jgi:tetratricopeptide (TPR) repeat protein
MSTRPILIVALLTVVGAFLWGCGGPTQKGIEARTRARARLNRVNAQLSYDQAMQAFEAGQFEKAAHELSIAIRLHPEWADYRVLEGRIYLETHRLEKAIESFQAALQLKPGYPEAHYFSGIVYQRWSDDAKAFDEYLAAHEGDPESVGYLLAAAESMLALGQFDAAKRLVEVKLAYFEHNGAMRHLLAQIAMLQDDPAAAVRLYGEARRLDPENEPLLEELAQAQYAAGAYGDCYRSAKELQETTDADRPDLMLLEARCLAFMDRLPEARSLYLALTGLRPTDADVWIELGGVAWELGDHHRMALCGARVTALAPDRYEGYMLKGINERHHGNLAEATMFLQEAAERAGDAPLPHLLLGRVLEQGGDAQGALDAYAEALRVQPDSSEARTLFAELSERLELTVVEEPDWMRNE